MPGGTYDFECADCDFTSTGWPTKKAATARGQQHKDEHESGAPMPELDTFRRDQGITVDADGTARAKG